MHHHIFTTHTELAKHISGKSRRELVSYLESRDPRVRMAANAAGGTWIDIRAMLAARSLDNATLCEELSRELGKAGTLRKLLRDIAEREDAIFLDCPPTQAGARPTVLLRRRPGKKGPRTPFHKWYGWWLAWAKDDVDEQSKAGWSIPGQLPVEPMA